MGVTQPALTQVIDGLERRLGPALFDRISRPLKITPYWHVLLDCARAPARDTEALTAKLDVMKARLRVGGGSDRIHGIPPVAISRLQADSPEIGINLTIVLNDDLRAMSDADELDMFFALITGICFGAACETRALRREEAFVAAPRGRPAHYGGPKPFDELAEISLEMTDAETSGRLMRRVFGRTGAQLPLPAVKTNSARAMINYLRRRQASGFLSRTHARVGPEISEADILETMRRRDAPLLPTAGKPVTLAEKPVAERRHD